MKSFLTRAWRYIAARSSFRAINQLLLDMALNGLGILNFQDPKASGELFFTKNLLPLYVKDDNCIFVDVGANAGSYTLNLASLFPNARLFAFEPNPKTFSHLSEKIGDIFADRITIVNAGLGRNDEVVRLYDRADENGSSSHGSLYQQVIEGIHRVTAVSYEVNITSLDNFFRFIKSERICLLKLDVEGHELEVLKGAAELLSDGRIDLIQLEFNEMNIVSRVFLRDIFHALNGYIAYRLLPCGVLRLDPASPAYRLEVFAFQNIVFVRQDLRPNDKMVPAIRAASSRASSE